MALFAVHTAVILLFWQVLIHSLWITIFPTFDICYTSLQALTCQAAPCMLMFVPGVFEALRAGSAPSPDFWKSLPASLDLDQSKGTSWGVYPLMTKQDGFIPGVYTSSGTSTYTGSVRGRRLTYTRWKGARLPSYVREHFSLGYKIKHTVLLCRKH